MIGILRIIFSPYEGFWTEIGKMCMLDLLIDLFGAIVGALGNTDFDD